MKESTATLLFSLLLVAATAQAELPGGMSGSWYNPAQSGHGIHLEILGPGAAIGAWDVYDPAGNPIHLYFEGTVVGRSIVANAYSTRGMKFGSFNRSDLTITRWGSMLFEFTDCDSGKFSWNADGIAGIGYGAGETPLKRLARIHGVACAFPTQVSTGHPLAGSYHGEWDRAGASHGLRPYVAEAVVDNDGRVWATATWSAGLGFVAGFEPAPVFTGASPGEVDLRFGVAFMQGSGVAPPATQVRAPIQFTLDASGNASGLLTSNDAPFLATRLALSRDTAGVDPVADAGFDPASLVGRKYRFESVGQFFSTYKDIDVLAGNRICVRSAFHHPDACEFEGVIGAVEAGLSMFEIELANKVRPGESYRGKGWVRSDSGDLVIVASDGVRGLGLVARPKP